MPPLSLLYLIVLWIHQRVAGVVQFGHIRSVIIVVVVVVIFVAVFVVLVVVAVVLLYLLVLWIHQRVGGLGNISLDCIGSPNVVCAYNTYGFRTLHNLINLDRALTSRVRTLVEI